MVNKIMCSLEGGYSYFKGVLTYIFKSKGEGLLKTKINLTVKKLCCWGMVTCPDLPV